MTYGKHRTRLDKIEGIVGWRQPQGPPLMSKSERWEFSQKLADEILNGGDGSMGQRFAELAGLNRVAVRNILTGGGRLGLWGVADEMKRVDGWLAEQESKVV